MRDAAVTAIAVSALALSACTTPTTDIYQPPSPLPPGANGDVLKSQAFTYKGNTAVKATYVLYRSTSATGAPIAVSGTILVPIAPYSGGARPIVAIAPETLGLGDQCARSKNIAGGDAAVDQALANGWAVASTDYEGLGTPGNHAYMVGQSLGRSVLDAVRAAVKLPGSDVVGSSPVGVIGFSQGGAAAGWAGELQPTYAPELNLKGVAAGGTPADLTRVADHLEGSFYYGLEAGAAFGFDAAYPELDLETYLNDEGRSKLLQAPNMCAVDMALNFAGRRTTDFTTSNPLQAPTWLARLNENRLGGRAPKVPVLLWHGTTDSVIPITQAETLRQAYCGQGVRVQWTTAQSDHLGGSGLFLAPIALPYLAQRFAGTDAPSNC